MKKILLVVFTLAFALHTKAQKTDTVKTSSLTIEQPYSQKSTEPLIVIDGNIQYLRGLVAASSIDPKNIESINILKDISAIGKYGADGNNGVIEIKTKNPLVGISNKEIDTGKIDGAINIFKFQPNKRPTIITRNLLQKDSDPKAKPLYVVDGKETTNIDTMDQNKIESVTILKDASATSLYKDKGKNGVILITTKGKKVNPEKN
ncbi:hypothetical protein [Pedobacter sp. N23S346]|uniref:hypothetical protein n=1 Tax=Pedobacter sp. N23S346 TaxID=3402750 RepID=UPI003AC0A5E6